MKNFTKLIKLIKKAGFNHIRDVAKHLFFLPSKSCIAKTWSIASVPMKHTDKQTHQYPTKASKHYLFRVAYHVVTSAITDNAIKVKKKPFQ